MLRDLVFAEREGFRPLSLDLRLPAVAGAPLIVFAHGGGWRRGSRRTLAPTMDADEAFGRIVAAGFAVASVDYRLSGEAVFPAQVEDVSAAVDWLRAHAEEYGFDATRIVLWGESAGATIAALVGLRPDAGIRGIVDWYGPADLPAMATELGQLDDPGTREAGWLGVTVRSAGDAAVAASPARQVTRGAPPVWIAHGLADDAVPPSQSELFAAALAEQGVPVELELVPGAGHMWRGEVDRLGLLDRALGFCARVTA